MCIIPKNMNPRYFRKKKNKKACELGIFLVYVDFFLGDLLLRCVEDYMKYGVFSVNNTGMSILNLYFYELGNAAELDLSR